MASQPHHETPQPLNSLPSAGALEPAEIIAPEATGPRNRRSKPKNAVIYAPGRPNKKPRPLNTGNAGKGRPKGSTNRNKAQELAANGTVLTPEGYREMRQLSKGLAEQLPAKERVRIYADIVKGNFDEKLAGHALRALERVEDLRGVVTHKERARMLGRHAEISAPVPVPAFALPPGSRVRVALEVTVGREDSQEPKQVTSVQTLDSAS